MEFNFDNIDYFYYHSTDFDVTRIYSIMKYGIMSQDFINYYKIPYYHRNFIHSSCKNRYISASHFPLSIWKYYKIDNELYSYSSNKITFIIDGKINAEDKKYYKKPNYTNERHVKTGIRKTDIKGIVIRKVDATKKIDEIPFNLNLTSYDGMLKKIFDTILFFKDVHDYQSNIDDLYVLIGKLTMIKLYNEDKKTIISQISKYMVNYISRAYKSILKKDDLNLLDIINLYCDIPIYVMTKYDIKKQDQIQELITSAKEKFELTYDNIEYKSISYQERKKKNKKKQQELEIIKMSSQMNEGDLKIFNNEIQGPMTKEGIKILRKIQSINKK